MKLENNKDQLKHLDAHPLPENKIIFWDTSFVVDALFAPDIQIIKTLESRKKRLNQEERREYGRIKFSKHKHTVAVRFIENLRKEKINIALAKKVLQDMVEEEEGRISIPYIQNKVAQFFDLSVEDLKSKSRKKNIVLPRQIAIFFARKYTDLSLNDVGQAFGGRDHTTIMHAIQKIKQSRESDLKNIVDNLEHKIDKNL